MIFSRSGRSVFPLLPPYGAQDPNGAHGRIIPLHPDGLTPYLGLRARLSQIWMNRWTILLLLVLARVLIAVAGMNSDMDKAKSEALSACTTVESMGSSMASMPHYLAQGVNEMTASGVESAVSGLKSMLMMTLTGVEELVIFFIKMMYQTYLCLLTLAVRGSVHVAVGVIEDATDFLNSTVKEIGKDIGKTVDTFEDGLNKFLDGVNSVASAFGGSVPSLNISSKLDALDNLSLPSSIDDSLDKLNSSIPTFDEVDKFVTNVLRLPFEEVKKLVNESLGTYHFDRSALPVPAKEQMKFCNDDNGITSFFDHVADLSDTARKIFIAVLVVAATLVCVPMAWQEIRRWHTMKERSQLVRKEAHDPMDVVYIVSRPYTAATGIKAASRFSNSRRQILVRWVVAYATSPAALFVLSLALAGLFACLCQYLLLHAVKQTVPELSTEVGAFADKIVSKLQNTSAEWANDANGAIRHMDDDLNDHVLGWVNQSTTAMNDTLNAFVDKTQGVLNTTFGDTILKDLLEDLFDCLIGLKIASIQKGLTWVHDHAHIDFPLLPNDTFSRGAESSINNGSSSDASFLADAGDTTSNKITEVVARAVAKIESGIRTEAIIASFILLLWVLNALIGLSRALSLFFTRDKNRGEGGGAPPPPPPLNLRPDANGFIDVPLTAVPRHPSSPSTSPSFLTSSYSSSRASQGHSPIAGATPARPAPPPVPVPVSVSVPVSARELEAESGPAPRYEAKGAGLSAAEIQYQDEKLGFAGHRSLKVDGGSEVRGSSYVEYGMEKH